MAQPTKSFSDGDIIFRKGDPSKAAYEVLSGTVEIVHFSMEDGRHSKLLNEGDVFGEIGLIDGGPRETDALAIGPVTVRVIPRKSFLARLESEPETAFKVMSKLAKRMKPEESDSASLATRTEAFRKAAANLPVPIDDAGGPSRTVGRRLPSTLMGERKPSMLERMLGGSLILGKPQKPKTPPPQEFTILMSQLSGDMEDQQRMLIAEALSDIPGVNIQLVDRNLASVLPMFAGMGDASPTDDALRMANREGRQWMREANADLLLWGDVDETGRYVDVRFVCIASSPGERPGRFTPLNHLVIPADFYDEWVPLIRAVVFGVLDPRSIPQGRLLRSILPPTARAARQLGMDPGMTMEAMEQAAIQMCYGNVACMCALLDGDKSWYQTAAESYRKAVEALPPEQRELRGHAYQQLALVLQIIAERTGNIHLLDQAANTYREALKYVSRQTSPFDWGLLKFRLGGLLYKLDMAEGDDNLLKEAIATLQSACEVFDQFSHPIRWSEIMNALAQCLQVYGDNVRSAAIIRRSVKTCQEALRVRTPDTAPLQWASIQNTLGSALFLLAKHTGDTDCITRAGKAFQTALIVYNEHGASRLARITERNLKRAEKRVEAAARKNATTLGPEWIGADTSLRSRDRAEQVDDGDLALRTMLDRLNEGGEGGYIPGVGGYA